MTLTDSGVSDVAVRTDTGRSRQKNEDFAGQRIGPRPSGRVDALFVVCDGMGGHPAGEVASRIGVTTLLDQYFAVPTEDHAEGLRTAIQAANLSIIREGLRDPSKRGMGTTCVAAVIHDDALVIGHAGDCRAYLIDDEGITQLTNDHSWVGEQMRAGLITAEQAHDSPYRSVVTRALGLEYDLEPDILTYQIQPGEILLLCSDGMWDVVDDPTTEAIIRAAATLDEAAKHLVDASNDMGGPDNITVLLVRRTA